MQISTVEEYGKQIGERAGLTKKQGTAAYNAFVEIIKEQVNASANTTVVIPRIGKLNVRFRESYEGRNPSNSSKIVIDHSRRVSLASFGSFKDHLKEYKVTPEELAELTSKK